MQTCFGLSGATPTLMCISSPQSLFWWSWPFDAWACTDQTLGDFPPPERRWFRWWYSVLASIMVMTPIAILVLTSFLEISNKLIISIEWAGITTFAIYWFLKTYELSLSGAEKRALAANLVLRRQRRADFLSAGGLERCWIKAGHFYSCRSWPCRLAPALAGAGYVIQEPRSAR